MRFPPVLPTELTVSAGTLADLPATSAAEIPSAALGLAQAMARALGTAYRPADGTPAGADVKAMGVALARARLTMRRALDEAFLTSADALLPEWERMLGLPVGASLDVDARRRRLLARWRARRGGSPQAIDAAVSALFPDGTAVTVQEVQWADVRTTVPERAYVFAVVVPDTGPAWTYFGDPSFPDRVLAVVNAQKPAHTLGKVTNRVGFRCDDPESVTDLTLLGS